MCIPVTSGLHGINPIVYGFLEILGDFYHLGMHPQVDVQVDVIYISQSHQDIMWSHDAFFWDNNG